MHLIIVTALLCLQQHVLADTRLAYASGNYVLQFWDKNSGLPQTTIDRLVTTYFNVYPKEVAAYNPGAPKENWLIIDPAMTSNPASTSNGKITCSASYFKNYPRDADVITHECMHIVQAAISGPGWLVEGIADYGRNQFGVSNDLSGWMLSGYVAGQNYTQGYGVTASFLVYVESKKPGFVKSMLDIMRLGKYTDQQWVTLTGSTVNQLWSKYATGK